MKCSIPEISWHNRDPVLSVDIQPFCNEEFYRLASGGTDCHVLIWYLKILQNGAVNFEVVSDLTRHQRAVNVVRWSPSGQFLASGDDDANIIIWNLKTDNIPLLEGETNDKEIWLVNKILRGHKEDVYDISWSPNGMKLVSGSIDNTAIIWDFTKGKNECILPDHKGFVQGVSWDPKGQLIATLCSDRVCRVFDSTGKNVKARAHKGMLPLPESHPLFNKEVKYFHDDTFKSYFRRLTFTPDGNLLIAPSGCIEAEDYKPAHHATFIFSLDSLTQPIAILPSPKQVTIAASCCPILFELHSEGTDPLIALPYRMIIAVATDSDVVLYDTQQSSPFAHLQKIHYTRITDLTWSHDGLLLIASSTDGFCTLVTFEPDELGIPYVKEDSDPEVSVMDISGCEEIDKSETIKKNKEKEVQDVKPKKPNILEQWTVRKGKNDNVDENNTDISKSNIILPESTSKKVENSVTTKKLIPKRIIPVKIADIDKDKKIKADEKRSNKLVKNIKIGNTEMDDDEVSASKTANGDKDKIILIDDESPVQLETPPGSKKRCSPSSVKKSTLKSKVNHKGKNSSLLNFLQINSVKKKSAAVDTVAKNKNETNKALVCTKVIDISDDESSNAEVSEISNKNESIAENVTCKNSDEELMEVDSNTKSSVKEISNKSESSQVDKNSILETATTEKENMQHTETDTINLLPTNDTQIEASTSSNNSLPKTTVKTPRRIPFITLSSPKRKKKE